MLLKCDPKLEADPLRLFLDYYPEQERSNPTTEQPIQRVNWIRTKGRRGSFHWLPKKSFRWLPKKHTAENHTAEDLDELNELGEPTDVQDAPLRPGSPNGSPVAVEDFPSDEDKDDEDLQVKDFEFKEGEMGITYNAISWGKPCQIKEVAASSQADKLGVQVEDEIIAVNGTNCENLNSTGVQNLIKSGKKLIGSGKRHLTLTIRRPKKHFKQVLDNPPAGQDGDAFASVKIEMSHVPAKYQKYLTSFVNGRLANWKALEGQDVGRVTAQANQYKSPIMSIRDEGTMKVLILAELHKNAHFVKKWKVVEFDVNEHKKCDMQSTKLDMLSIARDIFDQIKANPNRNGKVFHFVAEEYE